MIIFSKFPSANNANHKYRNLIKPFSTKSNYCVFLYNQIARQCSKENRQTANKICVVHITW